MKNLFLFVFILLLTAETYPQWVQTNGPREGNTNLIVHKLVECGSNLFAGTGFFGTSGKGIFRSTNNGMSWIQAGLENKSIYCLSVSGTNLFAGAGEWINTDSLSYSINSCFLSTDFGKNWTEVNSGLPAEFPDSWITSLAVIGTNIFAGTYGKGVFLSTNNGKSWTEVNSGLTEKYMFCFTVSGPKLFAGTGFWNWGGVFLTTNNGTNWTDVSTGLPSPTSVISLAISGTNLYAATSLNGVFLSTNDGLTWMPASEGLPRNSNDTTLYAPIECFASKGQNLFAGFYGNGVFLSTNSGINWKEVNSGLNNLKILTLAANSTYLYAGTSDSSLWCRPLSEMLTDVKSTPELQKEFALYQNYPNPFNPSTSIEYRVGSMEYVTLKVYDILGNEVAILINEEKLAGTYEVKWNAEGFSSGVYFYQLKAGSYIETMKMILLR